MQRTIGYQVARIITALLVAVPSTLAIATVTAGATTCLPTTFSRDGFFLTAAQIGGSVSGTLDASGCDIGVYFANPGSVTAGAQIFGARYFGVVNDGTSVMVEGASIHDMVAVVAGPLATMPPFWYAQTVLPSIVPVPPFVK